MQAVTRNPIADPGILGVSNGASLAVVIGIAFFGLTEPVRADGARDRRERPSPPSSSTRSGRSAAVARRRSSSRSREPPPPPRFASLISAIMLPRVDLLQTFQSWQIGGVGGAEWPRIAITAPVLALGALICFLSARGMNSLALGDDMAKGLGEHVFRTRLLSALGAVILARRRDRDRRSDRLRRTRRSRTSAGCWSAPTTAGCCRSRPSPARRC